MIRESMASAPSLAADLPGQFPTAELHDALSVDLDIVVVFPAALLCVVVLTAVTGCRLGGSIYAGRQR